MVGYLMVGYLMVGYLWLVPNYSPPASGLARWRGDL